MKSMLFVNMLFLGLWVVAMVAALPWVRSHKEEPRMPRARSRRAGRIARANALGNGKHLHP
jgi:hypothetical protein